MSDSVDEQTTARIVEFLVRYSPQELGPAYRFAAEHWAIIQMTLLALLVLLFLGLLSFAVALWNNG